MTRDALVSMATIIPHTVLPPSSCPRMHPDDAHGKCLPIPFFIGTHSICKAVLESFAKHQKPTDDPVIIQTVFEVARGLHDSIDSLTFDDERRQVALLIIAFIRKIDFGHDLEQQLNLYVECRAAFTNLDLVTRELVLRVALLCMRAHRYVSALREFFPPSLLLLFLLLPVLLCDLLLVVI